MAPYQTFSMFTRLICGILCAALALLVVLQLRHDKKSRLFAILTTVIAAIALNGVLLRLNWELNTDIYALFTLAGVLTGSLPFVIFLFANEYLDTWTPPRRLIAQILAVYVSLGALLGVSMKMVSAVTISPEGFVLYQMYPWTAGLLSGGVLVSLLTLRILVQHYRQRQHKANLRVLIGLGIMSSGILMLSVPGLGKYTFEQVFYAVGALIVVGPVFEQRLFDPLTQLNMKLARRAEQLSAITRVGEQTTALLNLDKLLNAIVREIQRAFDYDTVIIYRWDTTHKTLIARAASGIHSSKQTVFDICDLHDGDSTVRTAALSRKPVQLGHVRNDTSAVQSQVSIPLVIGVASAVEETLIGVLDIRSEKANAFGEEVMEVLQILANQTASAIHNAELFEQAQQARQAADEANRQKTRFLASMSHELRTPLQTIIVYSQWMLNRPENYDGVELPVAYRADMANIQKSGQHLHSLINNVLDLSKIEAGEVELELQAVDPLALIRDVLKTTSSLLKPGVKMQTLCPEHLPDIWADDLRIIQVLGNIVSNACKFCERGQITVDAQVCDTMLRFAVADTGIGIPHEAQAVLFSRFKQASRDIARQFGGTGLGLSICQQLVQLHGGEIWLESEIGKGSTFFFTIPLAATHQMVPNPTVSPQPQVFVFPTNHYPPPFQIVVIDTCATSRAFIETGLTEAGYKVLLATDPQLGVQWATALLPQAVIVVQHPDDSDQHRWVADRNLSEALPMIPIIEVPIEDENTVWLRMLLALLQQKCNAAYFS